MAKDRFMEKYNASKLDWLRDSIFLFVMIALVFVLFRFVIGLSVVGGDSMVPTLEDGNVVLYLRTVREYRPGDVVSVRVPSGDYYIKRVVAVGGDRVDIYGGRLYVNDASAADEHACGSTEEETGAVIYPYLVREGNVFLLGDNREVSMDSRYFGEVNSRQIKGRVILFADRSGVHRMD